MGACKLLVHRNPAKAGTLHLSCPFLCPGGTWWGTVELSDMVWWYGGDELMVGLDDLSSLFQH